MPAATANQPPTSGELARWPAVVAGSSKVRGRCAGKGDMLPRLYGFYFGPKHQGPGVHAHNRRFITVYES
jgi:hypothetical protein